MEEDQRSECSAGLGLLSQELPAGPGQLPVLAVPAVALPSHGQCVWEHQRWLSPSWICSLQEHQPSIWSFTIAEVSGAVFGAVVLGAAPVRGFLLWAVQQMNVSKPIRLEPSKGDGRGQDMFSGSLFASWLSWGLSWQGEQCGMGWGR